MTFKCPACKKIFKRDMRLKMNKSCITKRGYSSSCEETGEKHFCKPIYNLIK
jgi:hypothetical protein